jgi:hypothetical protein
VHGKQKIKHGVKQTRISTVNLLLGHEQPFRQFFRLDKAVDKKVEKRTNLFLDLNTLPLAHAQSYLQGLGQFFLLDRAAIGIKIELDHL